MEGAEIDSHPTPALPTTPCEKLCQPQCLVSAGQLCQRPPRLRPGGQRVGMHSGICGYIRHFQVMCYQLGKEPVFVIIFRWNSLIRHLVKPPPCVQWGQFRLAMRKLKYAAGCRNGQRDFFFVHWKIEVHDLCTALHMGHSWGSPPGQLDNWIHPYWPHLVMHAPAVC